VDPLNPAYSSLDGVLFNKSQTELIQCPGGKTGTYNIPNSVTSIGEWAFSGCTSLTSVTIGNGVTSIRWWAFGGCTSLTSVTIPDSVTIIWDNAFSGCSSLTSVTIPDSVTSIGTYALSGCTSLKGVYFEGRPPSLCYNVLGSIARVYYLPGAIGWGPTFGDQPTALWIPVMPNLPSVTADNPLRLTTHSPAPATVRVQRSANLLHWEDWQTVSRDEGPSELQDADVGTTPYRFYRLREQ
jgi:hypothetical protein